MTNSKEKIIIIIGGVITAQQLGQETTAEIIARDKKFERDQNIAWGIALGAMAGLIIVFSTKIPIQLELFGMNDIRVWFLLIPIVLAMENGVKGILVAIFGDLIGMSFTIFVAIIKIDPNTVIQAAILGLETLGISIFFAIIIAIAMKIGALILKFVLERMEPTLNKIGEYLTSKINKTNGNP